MSGFADKVRTSKPFSGIDVIILIVAVTLVACLALGTLIKPKGSEVEITAPGFSARYSLNDDRTVEVNGVTVRVLGGKVSVVESTCSNGHCVAMGEIYKSGQTIVCSPNAVVIKVVSEKTLDGVVG